MLAEGVRRTKAWLVGVINTDTAQFLGFGVFSEDKPTLRTRLFPFTALEGAGTSYEEGLVDVGNQLAMPCYAWMRRLLDPRTVRAIQSAQRRAGVDVLK
jgi:hypothetical protein